MRQAHLATRLLLALVALLIAAPSLAQKPGYVTNPYPVGPTYVPQDVIDTCRDRQSTSAISECIDAQGWPTGSHAQADAVLAGIATKAPTKVWEDCPPDSQPVRSEVGFGDWEEMSEKFGMPSQAAGMDIGFWRHTRFSLQSISESDGPALRVDALTEFDLRRMTPLILNFLRAKAPPDDRSCDQPLRTEGYQVATGSGQVDASFRVIVEKFVCTSYPCLYDGYKMTTCHGRNKIGGYIPTIHAHLIPSIEGGALLIRLQTSYDDPGMPTAFKFMGKVERLWNGLTFDSAFFRSNNYGAAVEQISFHMRQLAAMSQNLKEIPIAVPGMEVLDPKLETPEFYTWRDEKGNDILRLRFKTSLTVPRQLVCRAIKVMLTANHIAPAGR